MGEQIMTILREGLHLVRDVKGTVEGWSGEPWFAWVLFAVIFAETGLVILPFLPGDSLLFVVGAIVKGAETQAAAGGAEPTASLTFLLVLMSVAAIAGDAVNYQVGARLGPRVFASETSRWLNKKHLLKAQAFYEKYGAKTIVLARFVPIVRTFAPFVAGIGRMSYRRFALFNVVGGVAWVVSLTMMGYWFGGLEWVAKHFEAVVVAIIVISVLPLVFEYWKAKRAARA
jgi:membrane-associated protein